MRFKAKKSYGNYKISKCPFCDRQATQTNQQGLEVCHQHTNQSMEEIKCVCGSWLEQRVGKFGAYFNCVKCGNMNYKKDMDIKEMTGHKSSPKPVIKPISVQEVSRPRVQERKELTITSNDAEFFD